MKQEPRYIVIEGPIGVGKTSLTHLLSKEMSGREVLERVEDNPFLLSFYKDPERYAFQTQIFFLLSRYRQIEELNQPDLFQRITLTDYFLPKDRIFATLNLSPSELLLYDQVYALLNPRLPKPDLVISLQAQTETLMERIRLRGREYEKEISWDYLHTVNQAYNDFFFHYNETPLLVIQTTEIDFVHNRMDLEDLHKQIQNMGQGTQYYIPRK
jgi:deoxyadenosine/deoxycytidine kinase